jgi:hypothetical protein
MNILLAIPSSPITSPFPTFLSFYLGVSCCGFMGLRLGFLERVSITGKTDRDIGFRKTGLCYEYHLNFSIGLSFLSYFSLGCLFFG